MNSWKALRPKAWKLMGSALRVYVLSMAAMFFLQRFMLYHPMPALAYPAPNVAGSAQYWRFDPVSALNDSDNFSKVCGMDSMGKHGAVAYFPGNAEPASMMAYLSIQFPGCPVYALDYPSYEGAPGSPSEASILAAAKDMMARMASDGVEPSRTIAIGRSLGSGVAVSMASSQPCLMAGLLTPYDSLDKVAFDHFPFFPMKWLMLDQFDASKKAPVARCPAAIVSAQNDTVIPEPRAKALAGMWNPNQAVVAESLDSTHEDIGENPRAWAVLRSAASSAFESRRSFEK